LGEAWWEDFYRVLQTREFHLGLVLTERPLGFKVERPDVTLPELAFGPPSWPAAFGSFTPTVVFVELNEALAER
jgi:hypothetical protein